MQPAANFDSLPELPLHLIIDFAVRDFDDIKALTAVSSSVIGVLRRLTADGNAHVYRNEFASREPKLFDFLD